MRKRLILPIVEALMIVLLFIGAIIARHAENNKITTMETREYAASMETFADISASAVHDNPFVSVVSTTEELEEEATYEEVYEDVGTDSVDDNYSVDDTIYDDYELFVEEEYEEYEYYPEEEYEEEDSYIEEDYGDYISRERIIDYAWEVYGVSEEWTIWLIGTTSNEGYQGDRYLEYAWACEIINCYRHWSVWDLDCIWGGYYSIGNVYSGYYSADDTTLQMVWEALTDLDTRICEVDGMIDYYVPGYYLIYDSPIYNCQVWGN